MIGHCFGRYFSYFSKFIDTGGEDAARKYDAVKEGRGPDEGRMSLRIKADVEASLYRVRGTACATTLSEMSLLVPGSHLLMLVSAIVDMEHAKRTCTRGTGLDGYE